MAGKPEVRMSEGKAALLVLAVVALVVGGFTNWYGFGPEETTATTPTVETGSTPTALTLIPAIEKTKVYASTYDQADYDGESQKNRVAGTMELIKSGNSIDTVTTVTTGAAASTAEFNGGDKVIGLGDASGYYAHASDEAAISETLQPFEVFISAAGVPDVAIEDDNGDAASTATLDANEVTKTHSIVIERPGDDTYYQFCGIAADYDDEVLDPRVKVAGSFDEGLTNLDEDYDFLDAAGFDAVWAFDEPIKNFDEISVDFLVGTEKDVDPNNETLMFQVFDCEENLQNGLIVYTNEDSADADVGLAGINATLTLN